jgi:hypothetical protein
MRTSSLYDPSTHVPYRAYAYLPIKGAVLMACRRRNYQEATHDELPEEKYNHRGTEGGATPGVPRDQRPLAEAALLAREEQRLQAGSRLYVERFRLILVVSQLPAEERDVVRLVLGGGDVTELDRATRLLLQRAVRLLKRTIENQSRNLNRRRPTKRSWPRFPVCRCLPDTAGASGGPERSRAGRHVGHGACAPGTAGREALRRVSTFG